MSLRLPLLIITIICFLACNGSIDSSVEGCTDSSACNYNTSADTDDGSCLFFDECGVCGGGGIPTGACDCIGNVIDCNQECGGLASADECGACDPDPANNCIQDCLGQWGGDAIIDVCGVCNGGAASASECNQVCEQDCFGLCPDDIGYGAELDECGVCGGVGIPDDACDCTGNVLDCNDECGGLATADECGVCDSNSINNCQQDCFGEWGGNGLVDLCGICGGDNSSCSGCMNSNALNYDQNATIDDGTCEVPGCTDPSASNYNQDATSSDGSCQYGSCTGFDVCLGIENVNLDTNTLDIVLHSNVNVHGFQFNIGDWDSEQESSDGLSISDVYGGESDEQGFTVSSSTSTVIGFSLAGAFISAGSHTLLSMSFVDFSDSICISNPILSDSNGSALDVSNSNLCYPLPITGESQLILFKDTVSNLQIGDIVYIYDSQGIKNSASCESDIGKVLVAVGLWNNQQLELSAVGSLDMCSIPGGLQLPGYISGNDIEIEIGRENITFSVSEVDLDIGIGKFGDVMTVISEIYIN